MTSGNVEERVTDRPEPAAERPDLPGRSSSSDVAPPLGPNGLGRFRAWRRKKLRPFVRDVRWIAIGLAAVAAIALGCIGFEEWFDEHSEPHSFGDVLYRSIQLFALEGGNVEPPVPWTLEVARLLAPVVAAYAVVSAVASLLREQLQLLRLRFVRDHVVVCGLGERGLHLTKALNARGARVVAIEKDSEARGIEECREEGVIVLIGDVTDRTMLRKARVERARHVIAVARDDAVNAEVAVDARSVVERPRSLVSRTWGWFSERVLRRRQGVVRAVVHVVDPNLCRLLREKATSESAGSYELEFFSVYEIAARILVAEHVARNDGDGPTPRRIVVVGLGALGEAIVLRAAAAWREEHPQSGLRLEVGIVDQEAERKTESLHIRHEWLQDICQLTEHEMNIKEPAFSRGRFLVDGTGTLVASAAVVCFDDDGLGLRAAQSLLPKTRELGVPLVVRMRQAAGLATLVGAAASDGEDLHVFPLLDRTCAPELVLGSGWKSWETSNGADS